MKTVGDLRKAIHGLPDSAPLLSKEHKLERFAADEYNTREIALAYGARDDRYGSSVLLLELGDFSR